MPKNNARFLSLAFCFTIGFGCGEDRVIEPMGSIDGGAAPVDSSPRPDADPNAPDGGGQASSACDMSGVWITAQVVFAEALGASQKTVNWLYHDISQVGDTFTINKSLNCGFRVTGTTTVTIPDDTLEALARNTSSSVGRQGTFREVDGQCEFDLNRTYNIRAVNKAQYLTDHWVLGDADKALDTFPALPAGNGMEDWDNDGKHGFTLVTGLGERYVAQRDWNEHAGTVPTESTLFGGDGVVVVTWDAQESVSDQTSLILRTTATPQNPGWAWYAKVGGDLEVVESGDRPELTTCKNVQRLALETFED